MDYALSFRRFTMRFPSNAQVLEQGKVTDGFNGQQQAAERW